MKYKFNLFAVVSFVVLALWTCAAIDWVGSVPKYDPEPAKAMDAFKIILIMASIWFLGFRTRIESEE